MRRRFNEVVREKVKVIGSFGEFELKSSEKGLFQVRKCEESRGERTILSILRMRITEDKTSSFPQKERTL